MPNPYTKAQLRGVMAKIARAQNKSLSSVSTFEVNKELKAQNFVPLPPRSTDMKDVLEELRHGPYPTARNLMTQFSFEYWFNYFCKEMPTAGNDNPQLKMAANIINDDGTFRTENQVPNKPQLFQEMLRQGFRQFVAGDHLTAQQVLAHAALDPKNDLQRQNINVLFRGDGRGPDRIRQDDGTRPQSQIDQLRIDRGMTKDWHPFRTQGNVVWLRNGDNKDNCLFSAVSVTPQFYVATKFPLLNDLLGSNPDAVGHAIVVVRDRNNSAPPSTDTFQDRLQAARNRFSNPAPESQEKAVTLAASKTNLYGVVMRGVYNTQAFQVGSTFPEYASDDLSWADHLVYFSVTRIHFGSGDANAGHLILVNEYRWLQPEAFISQVLVGPGAYAHLRQFVEDIYSRGKLTGENGGIIYTPPGVPPPDYEIVRIRESFVAGRGKPQSLAAAAAPTPAPRPLKNLVIPPAFNH